MKEIHSFYEVLVGLFTPERYIIFIYKQKCSANSFFWGKAKLIV